MEDDTSVPPATSEKVEAAVRLAEQAADLTQQLLSFARKQALRAQEIELDRFLNEFRGMLSRTLDPRIRIEVAVEPGVGAVSADPSHLRTALLNIAVNARDAMPSGGSLKFEAPANPTAAASDLVGHDLEGLAIIRVIDTGSGIAPEDLPKVCDPFFSTKGLKGNGMGLAMVHGFAKQSGGTLRITSEEGKGTCVELWLPLASTAREEPSLHAASPLPAAR